MPGKLDSGVFFAAVGLGFMIYEICLIQKLTLLLGHPTRSLTVTLMSLLVFTGIGLTELALGAALWRWGTVVAAVTPGRRGSIATYLARGAAAAGVIALLGRLSSWVQDVDQLAASDFGAIEVIVGLGAGLGFSLAFIGYGVLMIRGEMPTSLGVVWVLSGLLSWAGILPLWFFFGALVFGIVGLIRFRGMRAGANRVAGIKRTAPVPESLPST